MNYYTYQKIKFFGAYVQQCVKVAVIGEFGPQQVHDVILAKKVTVDEKYIDYFKAISVGALIYASKLFSLLERRQLRKKLL